MKKLLIAIICSIALLGCGKTPIEDDGDVKPRALTGAECVIRKTKIDGHEYIIFRGVYEGGICHSASCPCHTNRTSSVVSE